MNSGSSLSSEHPYAYLRATQFKAGCPEGIPNEQGKSIVFVAFGSKGPSRPSFQFL